MIWTLQDSLVGKCTVDSKDNKEDKTREEADMTLSPFFPKSSKVVQKGGGDQLPLLTATN